MNGRMTYNLKMSEFKSLEITTLPFFKCKQVIEVLPKFGIFKANEEGLAYLDIDDRFIHEVYPVIHHPGMMKPDYFDNKTNFIGAHVSVIYPHECVDVTRLPEQGEVFLFEIESLISAQLLNKRYYALKIHAPQLTELRLSYKLPNQLNFNGFWIDFHITVAVEQLNDG